ncbi:MAG: hypothetical protein ACRD1Y_07065 [Terriglobales bacterium]
MGLWSAWVAWAALAGADFSWRIDLRPWALKPGFWASYAVSAVLAPLSAVVVDGFVLALLGVVVCLRVSPLRVLLAAFALWLLFLCTLRITSSLRGLTRAGGPLSARWAGYLIGLALAGLNWHERGLAPMHWLDKVAVAPLSDAGLAAAALLALFALLGLLDGSLARRNLLEGGSERRTSRWGSTLLRAGSGPTQALRCTSAIALLRARGVTVLAAYGGLFFPVALLVSRQSLDQPGMGAAICAFALLFPYWTRGNLLGFDSGGCWRYSCAGARPSVVLVQRGLALSLLQCIALAPSFVLVLAWRPGGPQGIVATAAFLVATLALSDAAGLPLSRAFPVPTGRSLEGADATAGALWILPIAFVWPVAFVLTFVRTSPAQAAWIWPPAVAVLCLAARELAIRVLRREPGDVWTSRVLTALGAL